MAKKILSVCLAAVFVFTNLELGFAQIPDVAQIMKEIEGRRKTNGDKAEPEPEEVVYKKFQCPSCDREFEIGVDPNDLELKRGTKKIVCPYDGAEFYPKDFVEEEEELQYETVRCPSCGRDFKAYIDVKGILAGRPQMLICPYDKNKFYFKAEGFKPGPLLRANLATVICPNTRRTFKAYIDPENPRELVSPYDGTRFYPTPDLIVPEKFMAGNGLLDAASGLSKGAQQSLVMPENRSVFPRHTPIEDAQSRIERMFSEHIPFTVSKYISQFGYDIFKPSQPIMGEGLQQGKEGFEKDTAPESKFLKSLFGSRQQESIFGEKDAALEGGPSAFISPTEVPEIRDYVLGPGDDLKITIWGQVQQIFTVKVDPEGKVLLPKIGPLYLWGLKFSEAEKKIKDSLLSAYTNIQVEVSIGKLRAIKVFVLGEAEKPGAHTISALSNIFHAIYAAGGPTKMGSMRKIRLRREGKPEMPVDLYNILLKGDSSQDYKLQGDDVLFIPPIGDVIGIAGNVKRPAIYEMSDKMRLSDLINMAGGLSSVGSLQRIQLERVKDHQKKVVLDLEFKSIADLENSEDNVTMQDGDLALIFPIVPIRYNFVSITGNVLMPGDYELKGEMRLKDLMDKAGGILPGTYLNRAEIARFKGDQTREIIPVDLADLISDKDSANIRLKEWDIITVYSKKEVVPAYFVEIDGAVERPGKYEMTENMRLSDLIFRAGGLKTEALMGRAELFRPYGDSGQSVTEIDLKLALGKDANNAEKNNLLLKEGDHLFIRKNPDKKDKFIITLNGEFVYPGKYAVEKGTRLSDVIERAGGFTKGAFLNGAFYTRQSVKTAQKKMVRNFVDFQQRAILQEHSSLAIGMAGEQATARNKLVEYRKNLLDKLEAIDVPGRILIRLNSNMDKFAKSNYDFPVEDGDTLLIPMKPSTVQVVGEVYGAGTLTYNSRKGADYYLHKAGGLTKYADLNRIFVIRANGETVSRFVRAMKIERGDAIIVPEAFKYKTLPGIFFKDVVQTLYQITLGAIVSITAINSL